ncbi:MAG TPA: hypothetical protein VN903_02275 [Polyangia bacterium]|jgi:hypothetical protein|nr:hypothetical protein [Polyangia bacterium]
MFASRFGFVIWLLSPMTEGIGLQIGPPVWTGECGLPRQKCTAELPIVVENRRADRVVTVGGFELTETGYFSYAPVRHFSLPLVATGPGAASRRTLPGVSDTEKTQIVRVWLRFESGPATRITSGPFVMANPSREAAKLACTRDRGDWRTSMRGRPYCVPRAPDGGKTCHDGNECKGVCLFDRDEPVGAPEPFGLGGRFLRQKWRPVGHCSPFLAPPSCYADIARGRSSEPPSHMHTPASLVCSD